jgi:hypothetical protein
MKLVQLLMKQVIADERCQARAVAHPDVAEDYAEALKAGCNFPPIVVFRGADGVYRVADGFHRLWAHVIAGRKTIEADVRTGELRDAILFAVGANVVHGLRRGRSDKRKAVFILLTDPEWGNRTHWPNTRIADMAGVSEGFVRNCREEYAELRARQQNNGHARGSYKTNTGPDMEAVEELTDPNRPRHIPFRERTADEQAAAVLEDKARSRATWEWEAEEAAKCLEDRLVWLGKPYAKALESHRETMRAMKGRRHATA